MNPEKFHIRPQFRKISVSVNCNLIFIPLPYFFLLKLFITIALSGIITPSLHLPSCRKVFLPPRKALKRLRQNFMFVETTFFGTPRQRTRYVDAQRSGNSICPWRWVHDDNPNRVPRFLTKAVCPNCKHYCHAIRYSHRGLVQKCDVKTGEAVWQWTVVELPVAFIYDP